MIGGSPTWEVGELLQLQGQSDLHNEFRGSMGYRVKTCFEKRNFMKKRTEKSDSVYNKQSNIVLLLTGGIKFVANL